MFRTVPVFGADQRAVSEVLRGAMNGKTNNHGTITLATGNATTTTLYDERISPDSKIVVIPFSDAAEVDSAPYGEFTNTSGQTATSSATVDLIVFDSTESSSGIYLSDSTKIYVLNDGMYSFQYTMQLKNTVNTVESADIWIRKNGVDVVHSASRFGLAARKSGTIPFYLVGMSEKNIELSAGDYVQIAGSVTDVGVELDYYAADLTIPRPSVPSVTLNVNYIAPKAYADVYISAQFKGSATLSHFANDTANKTYAYVIVG